MAESKITVDNTAVWVGNISSSNASVIVGGVSVYRIGKLIQLVLDIQQKTATASTLIFEDVPTPRRNLQLVLCASNGATMVLDVNTNGTIKTSNAPSSSNNGLYFGCTAMYVEA